MSENIIKEEEKFIPGIFNRLRKRNFRGTEGQVVKNSIFQLAITLIAKIGSLLFTIIIARMLLPELFGLYLLSLSTIILFSSFADLGIGPSLITFVSKNLGLKKMGKAKAYFRILLKYKLFLVLLVTFVFLVSAYFIANNYYDKPVFYAFLAGALYIPSVSFLSFLESSFKSTNNFKFPFFKEIFFQGLRILLVPLAIFLLLKYSFSNQIVLMGAILFLGFSYFLSLLFLAIFSKKQMPFLKSQKMSLEKKDKIHLKKFMWPLVAIVLSGVFFGYIDMIMLGHFVSGEFIGYYGAAFGLIGSASVILGFISGGVFPIFARLRGKSLEKAFRKTVGFTFLISLVGAVVTFFFSSLIIKIVYGNSYLPAELLLKFFALLLIIFPLTAIYDSYFISQEKTKLIAILLVVTTVVNIILNYFFITYGLRFGMAEAVIGACFATIFSRILYFIFVIIFRKKTISKT